MQLRQSATSYLSFPVGQHRGMIGDDGTATVYAKVPSALQLFAEGFLPRVGGDPVELTIGYRKLGATSVIQVRS